MTLYPSFRSAFSKKLYSEVLLCFTRTQSLIRAAQSDIVRTHPHFGP
jgi:hypothetical protein